VASTNRAEDTADLAVDGGENVSLPVAALQIVQNGRRVFFYTAEGGIKYSTVASTSYMEDGTEIANLVVDGGGNVCLPMAILQVVQIGTRVFFRDANGDIKYGTVTSTSHAEDGTETADLVIDGGESVSLPVAILQVVQKKISEKKRETIRQYSDDSIMNMPATISRSNRQGNQGRGFWDDVDHNGVNGTRAQKSDTKRQRKHGWLRNIWKTPRNKSTPAPKENAVGVSAEGHSMRRMHRTVTKGVVSAREKLRVLAAGNNPRARRSSQEEPESDGENDPDTDPTDPNTTHGGMSSDDESVYGLVDTVCFCLCLPCCK